MTQDALPSGASQPLIPCTVIVYRAIRARKYRYEECEFDPEAYWLRPNEEGLTVGYTVEGAIGDLTGIHVVASLHVGTIRDLGLLVEPKADNSGAQILNVPRETEDPQRAEYLQSKLVGMSRVAAADERVPEKCKPPNCVQLRSTHP